MFYNKNEGARRRKGENARKFDKWIVIIDVYLSMSSRSRWHICISSIITISKLSVAIKCVWFPLFSPCLHHSAKMTVQRREWYMNIAYASQRALTCLSSAIGVSCFLCRHAVRPLWRRKVSDLLLMRNSAFSREPRFCSTISAVSLIILDAKKQVALRSFSLDYLSSERMCWIQRGFLLTICVRVSPVLYYLSILCYVCIDACFFASLR